MRDRLVRAVLAIADGQRDWILQELGIEWMSPLVKHNTSQAEFIDEVIARTAATGRAAFVEMVRALSRSEAIGYERDRELCALADEIAGLDEATWETTFDEAPGLWDLCSEHCRARVRGSPVDALYVRRESLHNDVAAFLASDRTIFVLVGRSGMGKTTFINQMIAEQLAAGHLALGVSSDNTDELPASLDHMSAALANLLTGGAWPALETFVAYIERKAVRRQRKLLIAVDAVNEFNRAAPGLPSTPKNFLAWLDERARKLKDDRLRHVKLLISLRPETWAASGEHERLRNANAGGAYWVSGPNKIARTLDRFDDGEAAAAFERYCAHFQVASTYEELTELTRYHLRDPLLLKITAELHRGRALPVDLDITDLFERYEREVVHPVAKAPLVIRKMVDTMFVDEFRIVRDALDLTTCADSELVEELDPEITTSTGTRLRSLNILRDYGRLFRFTYDRFVEYLLSNALLARIRVSAAERPAPVLDVAFEAFRANLVERQTLPTVQRALRRCLRLLLAEKDSARLVRNLAFSDERGLSLAASVMSVIAMRRTGDGDGIDVLSNLLAEVRRQIDRDLRRHRYSFGMFGQRPAFPLIDVVYRLLGETEYRHWLVAQPDAVRRRHLAPAIDAFKWAFEHRVPQISGAAILYCYFLWKAPATRQAAGEITAHAVSNIGKLRLRSLLHRQSRLIEHVIGLLMLTLPDLVDRGRPITLDHAIAFVTNLDLKHSRWMRRVVGLGGLIGRQVKRRFARLPNPINLQELDNVFADPDVKRNLREVLGMLRTRAAPRIEPLLDQLHSAPNGFVLQMVAFAISVWFEDADEAGRHTLLEDIERARQRRDLPPASEYTLAIALYHINYFGSSATQRAVELMTDFTTHILREHRGKFELHGRAYDFNIVGTYGRVCHRHAELFAARGTLSELPAFAFALDALHDARTNQRTDMYEYVCQNIGLLGILGVPSDALEILGRAHDEIDALGPARDTVRSTIVQSLANIRGLYRSEVDRWVLEVREDQALYAEVTQRTPEFDLSLFHSWYFEHLLFNVLVMHRQEIGRPFVEIIDGALDRPDSLGALRHLLTQTFELFVGMLP